MDFNPNGERQTVKNMEICSKNTCTGCHACLNICSVEAITMEEDELGFLYPIINTVICTNCELCKNICPANNPLPKQKAITAIAAYSSNPNDRASSTSGGAASVFSQYIIKTEGVIYGCSGENAENIRHIRVSKNEDLYKLKGSKYVQSEISSCFKELLSDLQNDKKVLFIGTPCQVAGLKNFLQKEYKNLITVDLVCHGVPSQILLNENIKNIDVPNNISIKFRKKGKSKKEQKTGIYLYSDNSTNISSKDFPKDNYTTGFMYGLFNRESCYSCYYASQERCSDITIGDFWGFKEFEKFPVNEHEGLSVILPITEKGLSFFNLIKETLNWIERPLSEAIDGNEQLKKPPQKNKNYNLFKQMYPVKGFHQSCNICLKEDRKKYKKEKIRIFISKIPLTKKIYKFIKNNK